MQNPFMKPTNHRHRAIWIFFLLGLGKVGLANLEDAEWP
jgi:hypothetical protein